MNAPLLLVASLLFMSPDASDIENQNNDTTWSVGASLRANTLNLGSLRAPMSSGTLGSLDSSAPTSYGLSIEYFTSDRLTWMLRVSGNYNTQQRNRGAAGLTDGESATRHMALSLSGGPRWIFNPGQRVEVSGFAVLGATYRAGETSTTPDDTTTPPNNDSITNEDTTDNVEIYKEWGWSIGSSLGIAFEMQLINNLHLRLFSSVVSVSKSHTASRGYIAGLGPAPVASNNSFGLNLDIRPGIELRMAL